MSGPAPSIAGKVRAPHDALARHLANGEPLPGEIPGATLTLFRRPPDHRAIHEAARLARRLACRRAYTQGPVTRT